MSTASHHQSLSLSSHPSFLAETYEKDNNAIYELCRVCLGRTGDEKYISIDSALPWSKLENCSAQKFIEQFLNRELKNIDPQPQRICSKCVKQMKAISAFRHRCIESENALAEFHKLHSMQTIEHQQQKQLNNAVQIVNSPIKHDLLFGIDGMMMFPESISEKMLPLFDSDLLKLEQRVMLDDEIRRHDFQNSCAVGLLSPSIQMHPIMNSEVMPVECHIIKEEHQDQVVQDQVVQDQVAQDQEAQDQVVKVELIEVEIIEAKTTETIETSTETNGRPKRKIRKPEKLNDANLYVKHLLQEDTRTSPHKSNGYVEKKAANTKRRDHRKSSDENQFVSGLCEQCGLTFSNSNEYKKHIRNHEDKAKKTFRFTCNFCSKGFNHKQTFNIHHNSHTRAVKFQCDMCGKELATKNSLRIHFRYHLGIKNHTCPKCGHRFVTPRELRDHVEKKHAAVRAIACTYSDCSETFDSEYRLNLHLRVHETNYAFVCDICGVATVSKFRLGIHKKIHTGEMIRQCPICQKSLAHDNALRRHIKNVHGGNKTPGNHISNGGVVEPKAKRMITLEGLILTN